ncbi:MAG: hypothetical protein ACR2J0_03360 [Mycobacteriales bacterium]
MAVSPWSARGPSGVRAVRGQRLHVVCAQETNTGEIAGLTELFVRWSPPSGAPLHGPASRRTGAGLVRPRGGGRVEQLDAHPN